MPKPQQIRKYNKKWEDIPEFKEWIRKSYDAQDKAHCKFCNSEISARSADLTRHLNTPKHQKIATARAKQSFAIVPVPKEVNISAEQRRKRSELRIALFIAIKCSLR